MMYDLCCSFDRALALQSAPTDGPLWRGYVGWDMQKSAEGAKPSALKAAKTQKSLRNVQIFAQYESYSMIKPSLY